MKIEVVKQLKEPGSTVHRVFQPTAAELAFEGIEFAKTPIRVTADLENVGGGIRGSLEAQCGLMIECARCVERCEYDIEAVREIDYLVNPTPEAQEAELHGRFVSPYDGETIVLDEDLRQMLLLAMPMQFLCRDDCRGLCPRCGANLNAGACGCPREPGKKPKPSENPFRAAFDDLKKKKKM